MHRLVPLIALAILIMPLIGCSHEKGDTDFPPHKISYEAGHLKGEGGTVSVLKLDDVNLSAYPHLTLKEGFTLHRAIYKLVEVI